MRLSGTVMEIWPFEVLPGKLFHKQRSVVGRRSILLISYTPFHYVGNLTREEYKCIQKYTQQMDDETWTLISTMCFIGLLATCTCNITGFLPEIAMTLVQKQHETVSCVS